MNKKIDIDPIVEARKGKYFDRYSKEARERIDLTVEICNQIKRLGLSYKEVAEIAGISKDVIIKNQNGHTDIISIKVLKKIINKIKKYDRSKLRSIN